MQTLKRPRYEVGTHERKRFEHGRKHGECD